MARMFVMGGIMQETKDIVVRVIENVAHFYPDMVQRHQAAALDRRPLIERMPPDKVYFNDNLVWSEGDTCAQT